MLLLIVTRELLGSSDHTLYSRPLLHHTTYLTQLRRKYQSKIKARRIKGRATNVTLAYFTFMWPWIIINLFVIKPNRCTNYTNLLWHETVHVSDSSSVHNQEFIHCTLSNGTAVPSWSCSKSVYKPVLHIQLLKVQWINSWCWTDELSETCRVSWQNKFVKLMHVVGFITKKVTLAYLKYF